MLVKIVDRTDVSDPTKREGFSTYKLHSFVPKGLTLRDFFWVLFNGFFFSIFK